MALRDKTDKEQFEIWKKRVKIAKERHKEKVYDWAKKVIKEYSGDTSVDSDTGERYELMAQVIMSIEETVQPHLFMQNPTFFVKSKFKKSAWERREDLVGEMVNQEYTDIKATGHGIELDNERAILDARILPYGVTKTSYEVEGDIIEEPQEQGALDKIKQVIGIGSAPVLETPAINKEQHITERINPLDVYLDPTAEHITKQKYTVHRMVVPKEKLNHPRYKRDVVERLEETVSLIPERMFNSDIEKKYNDPDFKGIEIYEIHDLENRAIHTLANGAQEFLEKDAEYPLPEGSQFEFVWFIEEPNEVYPNPPLKYYRKRANEFSYIYSQVSKQIDKFVPKLGIDINRLDEPEKQKFKIGNLGALVGFKGSPQGAWDLIQPTVQRDLINYLAMIKELLNMESGVADFEVGAQPNDERKATETSLIARGIKGRRSKPQKRVKGFLRHQARNIWFILAKNAPLDQFVKVLGEEDAVEWWNDPVTGKQAWTDENLAGDFWFDYDVESILPDNEEARMAKDLEMLNTIKDPIIQQMLANESEPTRLKLSPVIKRIIEKRWKVRDESQILERLNVLSPEQEHDLWMQGQFPPITEDEMKNPQKLQEHFAKHRAWMNSPGFNFLPDEIKRGAITHIESYLPLLAKIQAKQAPGSQSSPVAPLPENPTPEPLPERIEGANV